MTGANIPRATLSPDELVSEHASLVRGLATSIAKELDILRDVEDLVGFGYEALLQAGQRYDASTGVPFTGFAYKRVRGAIYDGVGKMERFGRSTMDTARRAGAAMRAAEEAGELREKDGENHEDVMGLSEALEDLLGKVTMAAVATAAASDAARNANPEVAYFTSFEHHKLKRAIASLEDKREREVILWLYFEDLTLEECGRRWGVSTSMAYRIHIRALARLKESLS